MRWQTTEFADEFQPYEVSSVYRASTSAWHPWALRIKRNKHRDLPDHVSHDGCPVVPVDDPSRENGLKAESQIMIDKATAVKRERTGKAIGRIMERELEEVDRALLLWLGIAIVPGNCVLRASLLLLVGDHPREYGIYFCDSNSAGSMPDALTRSSTAFLTTFISLMSLDIRASRLPIGEAMIGLRLREIQLAEFSGPTHPGKLT